jgi:hypothetical protein
MTHLGLWVDDRPDLVLSGGYLETVKGLGISTVAVMVETSRHGFDPFWHMGVTTGQEVGAVNEIGQIQELSAACLELDLELVITVWPTTDPDDMGDMCDFLGEALTYGAAGVEVDLEGNWLRRGGYASMQSASRDLLVSLYTITGMADARIELTTHTGHRELSHRARVTPHVHRLIPQAYSVRNRLGRTMPWGGKYGPEKAQRFAIGRTKRIPGCPPLSMGLAAWSQRWPDPHRPGETLEIAAMASALDEALTCDPIEVRYWSSKFVVGSRKNGYSAEFIGALEIS